jgi:hypothetical protein
MDVSGQLHAPADLPPQYLLYRRLSGPQSRSGLMEKRKSSAIDWAISAPWKYVIGQTNVITHT